MWSTIALTDANGRFTSASKKVMMYCLQITISHLLRSGWHFHSPQLFDFSNPFRRDHTCAHSRITRDITTHAPIPQLSSQLSKVQRLRQFSAHRVASCRPLPCEGISHHKLSSPHLLSVLFIRSPALGRAIGKDSWRHKLPLAKRVRRHTPALLIREKENLSAKDGK